MKTRLLLLSCLCLMTQLFAGTRNSESERLILDNKKSSDREIFDNGYVIPKEKLKISDARYISDCTQPRKKLYSIEHCKDETRVTYLQPIYFDSQWVLYSSETTLVDRQTGDRYVTRGYADDMPIDRILIVKGCNGKQIFITLVFPRLKRGVKTIDIIERGGVVPTPSNNSQGVGVQYNIKIEDYEVGRHKKPKIYH